MKQKIVFFLLSTVFRFFSFLPIIPNTFIFESQSGGKYDDNPKAIYDYLKKQNNSSYQMFWSIRYRDRHIIEDKNIKVLYRFSIRWLYYMARAEFWVINARIPAWIPKRKETTYVQTWHGTPLKKLALDMDTIGMPGANLENYKQNFLKETLKWDYLIAPNQYSKDIFKSCFDFKKQFIDSGYPRNDVLYQKNNSEDIKKLKKKLNLPLDKKIILYAPTWRDDYYISKGQYRFKIPFDIEKVRELMGEDVVFVFRAHYLVAESLDEIGNQKDIYNFSVKEDISELYLVSDLLITDYSSVFFDYANLKKPMLFYAYDYEHYRDNLRGFYFDIENDSPGPFVTLEEDFYNYLEEFIQTGKFSDYGIRLDLFYTKYCSWEKGNASEQVMKQVLSNKQSFSK
ncbi:CDP-glycerol glycerophosphotransferase family protein [Carnobacterium inhibens]|uniref:CDP-glycerol glycerophosphotransferase family protein n=1 Tax=Carnobacterium inhibens TaxID=147709 RepID=A0ABR7TD49_9LACT|nr:CDP-glycerol glycerophosphotransferase family protein [Carnobacterium inhibens]MBC9825901.1 CDP-glycerol glycerophosphotransferase family protein [Carnobacterium inhibens]